MHREIIRITVSSAYHKEYVLVMCLEARNGMENVEATGGCCHTDGRTGM